jgi:3-oxoacyl-[acyl-carrier protein] reductase
MLPGLHARLAFAQLRTPDPDELEDASPQEALLAPGPAGGVGHQDLRGAVGEDLQRNGRCIRAVRHPVLNDPPWLLGELVQRDRFYPRHSYSLSPASPVLVLAIIRTYKAGVLVSMDPSSVLLTGRVAVVTGGGSGIGRGIALGLKAFGASVAIWERDADSAASAAAEVGGLGLTTDVRQSAEVDEALARTTAELGPVSILVNNAGGVFSSPILETSENGWDALYRANLKHVILCTQRVARAMVEEGSGGSIISVTSIEGVRAAPGYAAYAAAKAGVINFTKTAALELAPHGIRVNALAPDITLTEGLAAVAPRGVEKTFGLTVPMGRPGHVDEMAGAAVFLAGQLSSYITGQTIHVDGGTQASSGWYHHPDSGSYVLGPS